MKRSSVLLVVAGLCLVALVVAGIAIGGRSSLLDPPHLPRPPKPAMGALTEFQLSRHYGLGGSEKMSLTRVGPELVLTHEKKLRYVDSTHGVAVGEDALTRLAAILDEEEVWRWDGFRREKRDVLDGGGFGLTATYEKDTITASGYMEFPDGYDEVVKRVDALFQELLRPDTHSFGALKGFEWRATTGANATSYVITKNDRSYVISNGGQGPWYVDPEVVEELAVILDQSAVAPEWDGFDKTKPDAEGGTEFTLVATYEQRTIRAHGRMEFPPGYEDVAASIDRLLKNR